MGLGDGSIFFETVKKRHFWFGRAKLLKYFSYESKIIFKKPNKVLQKKIPHNILTRLPQLLFMFCLVYNTHPIWFSVLVYNSVCYNNTPPNLMEQAPRKREIFRCHCKTILFIKICRPIGEISIIIQQDEKH